MFGNRESISFGKRLERAWLAVNAYLDASHFDGMRRMRDAWVGFSEWMDRFHVSGVSRLGVELACEGLTLGLGGALLMLTLAQPAFRETGDDWLKKQDLAVTFLDRFGNPVGRRGILHDNSVPLAEIPDTLIKAVLATEDRRFYEHWGVDPIGTARALTVNARSTGVVQGGSTITQQLAKNLFLSNERTIERKIKEAFLAVWLEFHLTKKQILELYLDRAYMGGGTFGVQAAADFYFGKSVRDVTLAESAMLAGLFKAPTKFAPHINLPAARGRAADVLNNLVDAGFMTQSQIFGALRAPATPVDRSRESSPDWYLDWAFGEVKALADSGKLGSERVLTVRLSLDTAVQRKAEEVVETQLRENGRAYNARQAATVIMQTDGAVRAIVGGRDYGASQFNRAIDAMRQPGSSFKPYVYLTALLSGKFKPTTLVTDSPVCIGNWCPRNYGGSFSGTVPLSVALAKSLNTIAVKLAIAVGGKDGPKAGRMKIVETARKMGVTAPLPDTVSLPIGADEVTVLEHSASYAVFGNGGKRVKAWAASEIMNGRGDVIWRHDVDGIKPVQAFPPNIINDMNGMLAGVVEAGTGRRAILGPNIKVGGKTGTTNGYKDAWFCGFTGNFAGCVWYGNDDDTAMNNMTGGTLPAQTWHDIMEVAHRGIELAPLPGVPVGAPVAGAQPAPVAASPMAELGAPERPVALSRKSSNALGSIDQLIRAAGSRADASTTIGLTGGEARSVGGYMRIPEVLMRAVAPVNGAFTHVWRGLRDGNLSFVARALVAAAAGVFLGLWLTSVVVHGSFPFGAVRAGAWRAFPTVGSPVIDPYARAILAVSAQAPVGADEGVAFFAERDSDGRRLDGRCEYVLEASEPAARFWSLSLFDPNGNVVENNAQRYAITSQDALRLDRTTLISVGSDVQPGNWLPSRPDGPFVLMLSLYEANSGTATAAAADMALPTIRRGACRR